MTGYMQELRKLVGSRPVIMTGACAIVVDQLGRILLQRRTDDGTWGLPGGAMEIGETLEETARREVYEEVGLHVGNLELFGVFSGREFYHKYPNGDEVYNVVVVYITREFSGELRSDLAESSGCRFFGIDEIPSDLSLDGIIIKKYLDQKR